MKLEHGTPCICRLLGDLGLATATSGSPFHWFLLTLLFWGVEIIIHPEQLLDPSSFVSQLEAVIVCIQAGKEGRVVSGSEWDCWAWLNTL